MHAGAVTADDPDAIQRQPDNTMKTIVQSLLSRHTLIAGSLLAMATAEAQEFERGGKWAVAPMGVYLSSEEVSVDVGGTTATVSLDSAYGGGVALTYDLSSHFTLGVDLWGGTGDFKGSAPGVERSYSASLFGMNTFLDYNILKSRLTPLLSANFGFLTMSADVEDISAGETDLLFGVGGGVRWDISDRWFAKAVYRLNWTEFEGMDELTMVHGILAQIGYRF